MPDIDPPLPMRPEGRLGRPFAWLMERMNAPAYEAVLDTLDLKRDESLLEIGFGTGEFLRRAMHRMDGGYIAGADPTPLMVEMACRRLLPALPVFQVDLREAGADALDWPPTTFDAVTAIHSFQFWGDPEAALRRIHTLLKPGGRLCLCLRQHGTSPPDWLPNPLSRSPDETKLVVDLLRKSDFAETVGVRSHRRAVLVTATRPE